MSDREKNIARDLCCHDDLCRDDNRRDVLCRDDNNHTNSVDNAVVNDDTTVSNTTDNNSRFPKWLKRGIAFTGRQKNVTSSLSSYKLNTVCAEAKCPNRGECYSLGSAAFLILGKTCTRACAFCGVKKGAPDLVDPDEAKRLADAALLMDLKHVVITSVTRDDLPDGGASSFADAIKSIRAKLPSSTIEALIPDFLGSQKSLNIVLDARPDVLNHNVETVPRLYPLIRPQAAYERSLQLLKRASQSGLAIIKSGIMAGLGETEDEVIAVMRDLKSCGVAHITVGQYLRPSRHQTAVKEFINPEQFSRYEKIALDMGFASALCGSYVRSSYRAGDGV